MILNLGPHGAATNNHHESQDSRISYTPEVALESLTGYEGFLEEKAKTLPGNLMGENISRRVAARKLRMFCEAFKEDNGLRLSEKEYSKDTTPLEMAEALYTAEQRRILGKSNMVLVKHVAKEDSECVDPEEFDDLKYRGIDTRQEGALVFIPQGCRLTKTLTIGLENGKMVADTWFLQPGFNFIRFKGVVDHFYLLSSDEYDATVKHICQTMSA